MKDYAELADRLQRGLGKAYRASSRVLGVPGASIAVKLDPSYYLALSPGFVNQMARWGGMLPGTALAALHKTGNLVAGPDGGTSLLLEVAHGQPRKISRIRAGFVPAAYVDDALKLYGGRQDLLPVSDVALPASQRKAVEEFLKGKTLPANSAYVPKDKS